MSQKRPLILLSGGVDSTYLAQKAVETGYGFDRLYIRGGQGTDKIRAEKMAITDIVSKLDGMLAERRQDLQYSCVMREAIVEHEYHNHALFPSAGFTQAYAWFFGAMSAANPSHHSSVQIGYISGDQITPALWRLKQAWELLWPVFKLGELVPLEFPLAEAYRTKAHVLEALDRDLYKLCWVCELPVEKTLDEKTVYLECGNCPACVNRKVEKMRLELQSSPRYLPPTVHDERRASFGVQLAKEQPPAEAYRVKEEDITEL